MEIIKKGVLDFINILIENSEFTPDSIFDGVYYRPPVFPEPP